MTTSRLVVGNNDQSETSYGALIRLFRYRPFRPNVRKTRRSQVSPTRGFKNPYSSVHHDHRKPHFLRPSVLWRGGLPPRSFSIPGTVVRFGSWAVKLRVSTCTPKCLTLRTFGKPLHRSPDPPMVPERALSLRAGVTSKVPGHNHACHRVRPHPGRRLQFRWQPGQSAAPRDIVVKAWRTIAATSNTPASFTPSSGAPSDVCRSRG